MKTVAQKMGIKESGRTVFINAPTEAIVGIKLPTLSISKKMTGEFDYIHLFVKKQSAYTKIFSKLKAKWNALGFLAKRWRVGYRPFSS